MPLNEQKKNGTSISKSIISKNNNRKRKKNKQTVPVIFYFLFEFLGTQSSVAMSTVKIRKRKKSSHGIEKLLRAGGAGAHLVTTADPPTSAPETNRQRHGDGGNICFIFYFISCSCENIPHCSREISTSFVMLRTIGIKCNDKNKKAIEAATAILRSFPHCRAESSLLSSFTISPIQWPVGYTFEEEEEKNENSSHISSSSLYVRASLR